MFAAIQSKNEKLAEWLLPHMDPNAWTTDRSRPRTPLMLAIEGKMEGLTRKLLPMSDVLRESKDKKTALSLAIRHLPQCVKEIVAEIKTELSAEERRLMLWEGIQKNSPEAVAVLLSLCDPRLKDKKGRDALAFATLSYAPATLSALMSDPRIQAQMPEAANRALWFAFGGTNRASQMRPKKNAVFAGVLAPALLAPVGEMASPEWAKFLLSEAEKGKSGFSEQIGRLRSRVEADELSRCLLGARGSVAAQSRPQTNAASNAQGDAAPAPSTKKEPARRL